MSGMPQQANGGSDNALIPETDFAACAYPSSFCVVGKQKRSRIRWVMRAPARSPTPGTAGRPLRGPALDRSGMVGSAAALKPAFKNDLRFQFADDENRSEGPAFTRSSHLSCDRPS